MGSDACGETASIISDVGSARGQRLCEYVYINFCLFHGHYYTQSQLLKYPCGRAFETSDLTIPRLPVTIGRSHTPTDYTFCIIVVLVDIVFARTFVCVVTEPHCNCLIDKNTIEIVSQIALFIT